VPTNSTPRLLRFPKIARFRARHRLRTFELETESCAPKPSPSSPGDGVRESGYHHDLGDGVLLELAPIDEATAEQILGQQPNLLVSLGGPAQNQEEAIRELRRSVRVRIVEAFEYLVKDPKAATRIPISEEHVTD
jgi:hypothetical protein